MLSRDNIGGACPPKAQRQAASGISLDLDTRRKEALASAGDHCLGFRHAGRGKHHDLRFDSTWFAYGKDSRKVRSGFRLLMAATDHVNPSPILPMFAEMLENGNS